MRITAVRSRVEDLALTRPYSIAFRRVDHVSNVIVELDTDTGAIGFGAASPEQFVTGETLQACSAALEQARDGFLLGRDPRERVALCRELGAALAGVPAARAALDMAVHDLFAQCLELPLADALGRAHLSLPTSITIGIKTVEQTLEEAREYLGRGFRILKVKLGHDLEEDLERLAQLRAHCGRAFAVRVDPNQGYDRAGLQRLAARLDELGVEFVEQPLSTADFDQLRGLPQDLRERVAADESLLHERDALRLLQEPRPCGIWNIKLMKCGGVFPGLRIAEFAQIAGVRLMWGCMDESIISISAALHAALASPATRYLDLDGSLDLARDVVGGGFVLEDGCLRTSDRPGLGVTRLA